MPEYQKMGKNAGGEAFLFFTEKCFDKDSNPF